MISSKQKRSLRALAHSLKPVVHIGKDGLNSNVLHNVHQSLEAHELIKVQVLKTCPNPLLELALDIAHHTHSDVVQTIGKTIILYRPSKDRKIIL